jgi:hypothetical protein
MNRKPRPTRYIPDGTQPVLVGGQKPTAEQRRLARRATAARLERAAALAPFVNRHNARSWLMLTDRPAFVDRLLDEAGVGRAHYRELSNALQALAAEVLAEK